MIFSSPNMPSVKYNAIIYPTEEQCLTAQRDFVALYDAKPLEYKEKVVIYTECIPIDAFPIEGMPLAKGIGI
jgi:hypothetical protein